ncbi:MAG: T9SS type A sorting domain-containing protein, partial [Flavobacteriales bacterium]
KSLRLVNSANMAGRLDQIVSPTFDMSQATDIVLSFRYAYARRSSTNADQFRVFVSANCGENWSLRSQLFATSDLNTGGVVAGTFVPSTPAQWGFEEVTTIGSTFQVSDMRIRFDFFSDGGNNFYLDDINLNGMTVGLDEFTSYTDEQLRVVPNPASAQADLLVQQERSASIAIEMLDVTGRSVGTVFSGVLAAGEHRIALPVKGKPAGVYFVRTRSENGLIGTVRVVLE